jgi:hypothetical protein
MQSVYFLIMYDPADPGRDFGLVKVGITDGDVADRIAQLQTGNPHELRCVAHFESPYARAVEHFVHRAHAADMHHLEWLRCRRHEVPGLVDEARAAAHRIDVARAKEGRIIARVSNGTERRPTPEETDLHRAAASLIKELVPAELRLKMAEGLLHAATAATLGIPGVVRVTRSDPTSRFDPRRAEAIHPHLAERFRVERTTGSFRWRKVPVAWHFVEQNQAAEAATMAAEAAASAVLSRSLELDGWTARTPEIERLHDEFLVATQLVTRLRADIEELQTELTLWLDEHDALIGVCSYVRRARSFLDTAAFCIAHPDEAKLCEEPVPAQLRKHVYPTRSYWSGPA